MAGILNHYPNGPGFTSLVPFNPLLFSILLIFLNYYQLHSLSGQLNQSLTSSWLIYHFPKGPGSYYLLRFYFQYYLVFLIIMDGAAFLMI